MPEFPVTWKQIRTLTTLFFGHRSLYEDNPRFVVLNGGAPEGSARRVYRELTKFGFEVVEVSNVPGQRDIDESFISRTGQARGSEASALDPERSRTGEKVEEATAAFFANLLSLPLLPFPEQMRGKAGGDVTIVLGKDFQFTFFQDLISSIN